MFRTLSAAVLFAVAAPAAAQGPKLGVQTQIEFTGGKKGYEFVYPIEQGDRFRIQIEPVKGADMTFVVKVFKDAGDKLVQFHSTATGSGRGHQTIDYTIDKPLPGRRVGIFITSDVAGKANVLITKVGDEPAADPKEAENKKLREENAALRKELADLKAQLADIKKLLEAKKP